MPMKALQDLLLDQLQDVYGAEKQLVKALPKLVKAANSPALAKAITAHLRETEEHVKRLETVFAMFRQKPNAKRSRGMEGLIDEGDRAAKGEGNEALVDAGIIAAAQRVEHYEMAAYGCLIHYAELLGMTDAADLLSVTFKEERAADAKLTQVSDEEIWELAIAAGQDGQPEWDARKVAMY